mmetsp:Transcript_28713/g.66875  ORF Transcript_28713/g.66875 Transcript_28713/m.66875 type:complete len:322 (-) Transcript_28713:92-1057(-)|eukprot:CAMPEP_0171095088 /NCGR_PEP_ID=MMETSP0766_2-20121228/42979_1 /TAXON_ID=439317 /ORGANISM="Gambierdiscus australes, Strain CAWD 149" /LENGTH=321 /DNA_ID=CAMNT_0011553863 /DNA_START=61 /DNA_END=1026 /DNA_ORIENTATION=+
MVNVVLVLQHLSLWGATATTAAQVNAGLSLPSAAPTSGDGPHTSALQKHSPEKVKHATALGRQRDTLEARGTQQLKNAATQKSAEAEKLIHKKALRGMEVAHKHVQKEDARKRAQRQQAKKEQAEKEARLQKLRARWQEVQAEANAPAEVRKQHQAAAEAAKKAALEAEIRAGQKKIEKAERMEKYQELVREKQKAALLKEEADEAKEQRAADYRAKQVAREQIRKARERADPAREAALRHQKALSADSLSMTMKVDGRKEVELKVSKNAPAYILLPTAAHLLHSKEAEVRLKHNETELSLSQSMGRQGLKDGDVIVPVVS